MKVGVGGTVGSTHRGCQRHQGESEIITKARQMCNQLIKLKVLVRERSCFKSSELKLRTPEQSERDLKAGVGHREGSLGNYPSTGVE